MSGEDPYVMSISLNVLNHLGLNLYSNIPAVLAEVVANSYDADATEVHITVDADSQSVIIQDNGEGMTEADINERYLNVGYQRREDQRALSTKLKRPVMGRKGIGKLSLFSIARNVEILTAKDGQKNALRMTIDAIQEAISADPEQTKPYHPEALSPDLVDFGQGTKIVLTDLKKNLTNTAAFLRKRLARRFSVLGSEHSFRLYIDGKEVTIEDRDYYHKLQYVWAVDTPQEAQALFDRCKKASVKVTIEPPSIAGGTITGWIGTVENSGLLKEPGGENINKISLMVRGKLAHEDLMEEFNEARVFRAYLIGELHADFLDRDDAVDIATSSRQRIIEDDPRYQQCLEWLRQEITNIGSSWTNLRNKAGTKTALENEHIKAWFQTLKTDSKQKAMKLFGKINSLTIDDEKQRNALFAHSVLAFESLRYRDNLDALDVMDPDEIAAVSNLFRSVEDLESALYHQIVTQRLKVIDKLEVHMDVDVLEKVLQEHLFDNLWLLDPSWERATDRSMEERIGTRFAEVSLTQEEVDSRIDIRYKRVTGTNVIVELKRHSVSTDSYTLARQVGKYRSALLKYLQQAGKDEPVEVVCVVGRNLRDWSDPGGKQESENMLRTKHIRVVQYEQLLTDAREGYKEYLDRRQDLGRLRMLLDSLAEDSEDALDAPPAPV